MKPTVTKSDIMLVKKAIKNLKEPNGSTSKNIFGQIVSDLLVKHQFPHPRHIQTAVQSALRRGVQRGLFQKDKGKFKLANEDATMVKEAKRRRGRGTTRKRRRPRKKRHTLLRLSLDDNNSELSACTDGDETPNNAPVDKTRRRSGRGRGKRRRSKTRSRSRMGSKTHKHDDDGCINEEDNKNCGEENNAEIIENRPSLKALFTPQFKTYLKTKFFM